MARIGRIVAPGMPHHITQRGNRRQQTFFSDDDYAQGRFASYILDEAYLLACARYIEMNPVRAKLVKHPEE
ncbi:transposase [Desulfobacula sp.]|uniref:transposase n=1 Tax=Desulfobacula sp. TaxID=2593537 RepID=UPI0039B879F5